MDSKKDKKVYYFAYGSNLNSNRMCKRRAAFSERKAAKLPNHEFKLNQLRKNGQAAANIEEKNGCDVHGAVYACTEETLVALDKFEGVSTGRYTRKNVKVELHDGEIVEAVTYMGLVKDDTITCVAREYFDHILCGQDIFPDFYFKWLNDTFERMCVP